MPVTQFGVVYSAALNTVRRVVVPDFDDSEINEHAYLQPNENLITLPIDYFTYLDEDAFVSVIMAATNGQVGCDRCAVVDNNGNIISVIRADHTWEQHPDGDLIVDPNMEAKVGGTYINGVFIAPPLLEPIPESPPPDSPPDSPS